jgi:diguanylate cyclase (GGDEF)-like protein
MGDSNELANWSIVWQLLENLCILFTLITLIAKHYRDKILEIQKDSTRGLLFGIILFSLLALITMQLPIQVPFTGGVVFDIRLSVVILAVFYLGLKGGLTVALVTVCIRSLSGGIGAVWWGGSVFFLVVIAYITARFISSRKAALILAGISTSAVHMGFLCILALFSAEVNFISPFVSPERFVRLAISFVAAMTVGVWVLDITIRNILKSEQAFTLLKTKADTDGLTGLINYRHCNELLNELLRSDASYPLSVLMIDIDLFKKFNDTYGHATGDDVLRKTAETIVACVRRGDIVARYGGEEFVVILPQADNGVAVSIAERIRNTVESIGPLDNGVTVSIGVATSNDINDGKKDGIIAEADAQMYAAKRAGRNRIEKGM